MQLLEILNAIARKSQIARDWKSVDLTKKKAKDDLTEFFSNLNKEVPIFAASAESEKQILEQRLEIESLATNAIFDKYNTDKCQQLVNLILGGKPQG